MTTELIADIETDGLIPTLTTCHCLAIANRMAPTDVLVYADHPNYPPIADGIKRLQDAGITYWHNGVGFDHPALVKLYGDDVLDRTKVRDTMILGRLFDPQRRSHALASYGEELGFPKGDYNDWSKFTDEMAIYCARDVEVTAKVLEMVGEVMETMPDAVKIEHDFAHVIHLQQMHGFRLNVDMAVELAAEMNQLMADIELEMQELFPPITHERYSEKTGKRLMDKVEVFNPGSRKMIAERLIERHSWSPSKFTPTGSPQIDETILGQLPYPEAQRLSEYFLKQKQVGQINGWLKVVTKEGYVHGSVKTIGTATFRCAHFAPNMGQISKRDLRMREVWLPDDGHKLVGIDADALELRMLAHWLGHFDDGEYAKALLEGRKENGTDVHSRTGKLIGLTNRDVVKRATYAYLYGASNHKLTEIMKEADSKMSGKQVRLRMNKGITGLGRLSEVVAKAAERGWIKSLAGYRVPVRSPHSALNFLLQSSGSILMKTALNIFHFDIAPDVPFSYCANVHDEVQITCRPDDADTVGVAFANAIGLAGVKLKLNCPTSGSHDIGDNWRETH